MAPLPSARFNSILFPVDFSERSKAAAPFVLSMAQRNAAPVTLLHVVHPMPLYAGMDAIYPETIDFAPIQVQIVSRLEQFAAAELPGVNVVFEADMGDPALVVADYAENNSIGLIAMPTHGYGAFRRALLGSVTAKVLHDSLKPVWTSAHAPEPSHRAHPKPRYILVALDLKPESAQTLEFALQLAAQSDATLEMLHLAPEGAIAPYEPENRMHELLGQAVEQGRIAVGEQPTPDLEVLNEGFDIAGLIRHRALEKRIDLVVIGRGSIHEAFGTFRTHIYDVIREAPCPVMTV